jgi:hypothetical protein
MKKMQMNSYPTCAPWIYQCKYGNLGIHRTKKLGEGFEVYEFCYKSGENRRVKSSVIKNNNSQSNF